MGLDIKKNFENFKVIQIEKIVLADWNYKETDSQEALSLMETLKANLKRNGQVENIQVRLLETGYYEVINGNHRVMAFQQMEISEIICYDWGQISLSQAKRIAIETNETKFKADNIKLAETFMEISKDFQLDELAETMPYSTQDMENMSKLLDFDWNQYEGEEGDNVSTKETDKGLNESLELQEERMKFMNEIERRVRLLSHLDEQEARLLVYKEVNAILENESNENIISKYQG